MLGFASVHAPLVPSERTRRINLIRFTGTGTTVQLKSDHVIDLPYRITSLGTVAPLNDYTCRAYDTIISKTLLVIVGLGVRERQKHAYMEPTATPGCKCILSVCSL